MEASYSLASAMLVVCSLGIQAFVGMEENNSTGLALA